MPPEGMDEEDYKSLLEQLQVKPKPVTFNDAANQYYDKIKRTVRLSTVSSCKKREYTKQFYLEYLG
jgi:hypothetical protein